MTMQINTQIKSVMYRY